MNTATTISRTLLLTGALTICLMGGANLVYADSNSTGSGLMTDNMKQSYQAEVNELRGRIDRLFETLSVPMAVPETKTAVPATPAESQEFEGYDSAA